MVFRDKAPRHRILIVEDDWAVLEVLKLMLEEEDYLVVTAKNGREAIRLAASKPFDLVLTDISMPDTNGIEFARTLRAQAKTSGIRIAIHTGLDEHWVRERFADYDLFLTKAADTDVLVTKIRQLLEEGESPRTTSGVQSAQTFTTDEAMRAQQALRAAMGLGPETMTPQALVGMLADEIDQLRKLGKSDADLARLLTEAIGNDFPIAALRR